jgi:hypothetical protein
VDIVISKMGVAGRDFSNPVECDHMLWFNDMFRLVSCDIGFLSLSLSFHLIPEYLVGSLALCPRCTKYFIVRGCAIK